MAVENIVRKGEIACNKQFLFFSQCFLPCMVLISSFKCTLKCRLHLFQFGPVEKNFIWKWVKLFGLVKILISFPISVRPIKISCLLDKKILNLKMKEKAGTQLQLAQMTRSVSRRIENSEKRIDACNKHSLHSVFTGLLSQNCSNYCFFAKELTIQQKKNHDNFSIQNSLRKNKDVFVKH